MILSFWALEHWRDELPLVESQEFCWTRQVRRFDSGIELLAILYDVQLTDS
jgi:hypothetical protein